MASLKSIFKKGVVNSGTDEPGYYQLEYPTQPEHAIDTDKQDVEEAKRRLLEKNPESSSNAIQSVGPSRHVEGDDHHTGRERVKGKKRNKDRRRANDDTAADPVGVADTLVRKKRVKHGIILATVVSHGLAAPVFVMFAIAWEKADKEIGAAEENVHKIVAEVNGMGAEQREE